MSFFDDLHGSMKELVGLPGAPPPADCPKCGTSRQMWPSTRFDNAEPFFVSKCWDCSILICPSGHHIKGHLSTHGFGYSGKRDTNVVGCTVDDCGKFRSVSGPAFTAAASGIPMLVAPHLRDFAKFAALKEQSSPGHWMAIVASRLPVAAAYFYMLSRDDELNPVQFQQKVAEWIPAWMRL